MTTSTPAIIDIRNCRDTKSVKKALGNVEGDRNLVVSAGGVLVAVSKKAIVDASDGMVINLIFRADYSVLVEFKSL